MVDIKRILFKLKRFQPIIRRFRFSSPLNRSGRQRTPSCPVRLMPPASNQSPSAFRIVQLRRLEARGHKSNKPKRQRAPFRLVCLMLVASERAASAFRIVQLQGLEAHVISQTGQEGKERLHARFVLCHPPLTKALPHFVLSSSGG